MEIRHKLKTISGRRYNYIESTLRVGSRVHTISKYIGRGKISKGRINELIENHLPYFKTREKQLQLYSKKIKYPNIILTEKQRDYIDTLKDEYIAHKEAFSDIQKRNYEKTFLTKYVHNTTSIEGNTLTLGETDLLINKGIAPDGKKAQEIKEVTNMVNCIEYRKNQLADISMPFIKKINKILLNEIVETGGTFKKVQNYITGSDLITTPPLLVNNEIKELIKWYNDYKNSRHIIEVACIFHQRFVMIHPFDDGNGRTARELVNFILEKRGFPSVIYKSKNVGKYYTALELGNQGDNKPLIELTLYDIKLDYGHMLDKEIILDNWVLNEQELKHAQDMGITETKGQMQLTDNFEDKSHN